MTVTATLVGGGSPQTVQVVVDETPVGEPWTLVGSAGDFTWEVPGGSGVGDGEQLSLTDPRAPGNVSVVYTFTSTSGSESSTPLVVPFAKDVVLQTADGQKTLAVDLLKGSLEFELPTNVATFNIPGRSRPVVRYDVLGDVVSQLVILASVEETPALRDLLASGAPIVYRLGQRIVDLDLVGVIALTQVSSPVVYTARGLRIWSLGYTMVDDPFADIRLGAFAWDTFDEAFAGTDWDDGFDQTFSGLTWDQFDTFDYATL